MEKVTLKSNEYVVVGNYQEMLNIKNEALKRNTKITLNQKSYYPKYQKAINGFYEMGSQKSELVSLFYQIMPCQMIKKL